MEIFWPSFGRTSIHERPLPRSANVNYQDVKRRVKEAKRTGGIDPSFVAGAVATRSLTHEYLALLAKMAKDRRKEEIAVPRRQTDCESVALIAAVAVPASRVKLWHRAKLVALSVADWRYVETQTIMV